MTALCMIVPGDSIVPRGKITLAVEMEATPLTTHHFMEFLIVDHRTAYHGVLGIPTLKELWAVYLSSTYT